MLNRVLLFSLKATKPLVLNCAQISANGTLLGYPRPVRVLGYSPDRDACPNIHRCLPFLAVLAHLDLVRR
jgi:hypothetical protein